MKKIVLSILISGMFLPCFLMGTGVQTEEPKDMSNSSSAFSRIGKNVGANT